MEIVSPEKLLLKAVSILNELKIDYFVTGGFAISIWGRPRATFDIDIIVKLVEPKVEVLAKALRKISKAGYIDEDAAREAVKNRGEFNFIDPDTGLKVDFWVMKDDKSTKVEYDRRVAKKINGQKVYFVSPEDLVLSKLAWYKEYQSSRHLEDAESVLKVSKVDLKYLKKWASYHSVLGILKEILKNK